MADTLATAADLNNLLQVTVPAAQATLLLELATSVVQNAVGQRIVDITDTALIDVTDYCTPWLELPERPIRSVSLVQIDGVTVTDWVLRKQKLWRAVGWLNRVSPPSQAAVTYAHGYVAGSQYLQLARNMTLSLAAAGYGNPTGAASESIDDYNVSYEAAMSRMELTEFMRAALVKAYGRAAHITVTDEWD